MTPSSSTRTSSSYERRVVVTIGVKGYDRETHFFGEDLDEFPDLWLVSETVVGLAGGFDGSWLEIRVAPKANSAAITRSPVVRFGQDILRNRLF